ncbi:MAG: cell division protein FtsQ [Chitinispirillales bacterium]|jgi:cell division septal protein FtsQ|nr:cell division protein FtsQ [Chitinispirillales bacterium]
MAKIRRIGANRRKALAEQRTRRPRRVKKFGGAGVIAALCVLALFAIYKYSPEVGGHITEAIKSGNELSAEFWIINGSGHTRLLLQAVVDSLSKSDSLSIKKDAILRAAAAIPEIERVSIKSGGDKKTVLRITERIPAALVLDGSIGLIDKHGVRFKALPGQYYDLPLVTFSGSGLNAAIEIEKFNVIKKASVNLGDVFFKQISQIDFTDSSSVNLIFKSGRTEYIVGTDDIEERLAHIKSLREKLTRENREPQRADLRYRGLAYLSML